MVGAGLCRSRPGTVSPGNRAAVEVQVAPLPGLFVKLDDQRAARVCEVRRGEEAGRAELEVVAAPVEAECGFPPFGARRVGSAG
eukprot:5221159-Pyramimonas_sp.AAC.1